MKVNPTIHNRKSIRLRNYDYSQEGLYFITICTKDRECLFGKITGGRMILNDDGKMANRCWLQIPDHFPGVVLHQHIIMPNHIHGIIEIKTECTNNPGVQNNTPPQQKQRNEFGKIIPRSIGSIIRGYKTGVTKWVRYRRIEEIEGIEGVENFQPQLSRPQRTQRTITIWQRNYYEHIIRNDQAYYIISIYIKNNPLKWKGDVFSKEKTS